MLFNSYNSMLEVLSLSPFHRWRNRGTKLGNLLKVTQLIVVESGFELSWSGFRAYALKCYAILSL